MLIQRWHAFVRSSVELSSRWFLVWTKNDLIKILRRHFFYLEDSNRGSISLIPFCSLSSTSLKGNEWEIFFYYSYLFYLSFKPMARIRFSRWILKMKSILFCQFVNFFSTRSITFCSFGFRNKKLRIIIDGFICQPKLIRYIYTGRENYRLTFMKIFRSQPLIFSRNSFSKNKKFALR